jgi:hypothetical protein
LMTSVHSKLVQSRQYALLKTTSDHSVTASAMYAMTRVTAWMPVTMQRGFTSASAAGTHLVGLTWIQCGFKILTTQT